MDLVGRRRRTLDILSFVITVPRGTIPFPWTLDPDTVRNLADNAVTFRGEACLLSILDIGNALRSMSIEDQDRYKFQMSRVLSITRLLETRCQGLFTGLIEEIAKKKKARKEERR